MDEKQVIAYFRGQIKNVETESMPYPERGNGYGQREKRTQVQNGAYAVAYKKIVEFPGGYEAVGLRDELWLTAFLLLAKYAGISESLAAVIEHKRKFPLYLSFQAGENIADCLAAIRRQLEGAAAAGKFSFTEIQKQLALPPMAVVTQQPDIFGQQPDGIKAQPSVHERRADGLEPRPAIYGQPSDGIKAQPLGDTDGELAAHPFGICMDAGADGVTIAVRYRTGVYRDEMIGQMLDAFEVLLGQVLENRENDVSVKSFSMINDTMQKELDAFNETGAPYDAAVSVVDLLDEAFCCFGGKAAVVYQENDVTLTYAQLDDQTNRIAAYLHGAGIGRGDVVSILIPRGEYMPIAAIGVLKAGAAYQPLDPGYPQQRLQFMLEDAGAKLLIADQSLLGLVPGYQGEVLLTQDIPGLPALDGRGMEFRKRCAPQPDDLFILLYTSGSTGVPKGVMLEHRNVAAFIQWYRRFYQMDENSRAAAYASFGFDANMMDMYPVLSCGGQLHIIAEDMRLDLLAVRDYFVRHQVTHSFMTTQVGRQYAQMFADCANPRFLSVGGETLVPLDPPGGYAFYNVYGPTECTILTTVFRVDRAYANIPIGKPLDNMKLYVVDENQNRVPVGVPGELCIAGPQVARGYLNRPEQTAQAFVTNPFSKESAYGRMYRTGDIVRYLPDGNIEFSGRRDSQVKIRGFRIELSEVEEIVRKYEGIDDAAVIACKQEGGGSFIAAYVVSAKPVDTEKLHAFIRQNKPPYMVPAVTMQIDKIPLNQNQKVDKRALPKPERAGLELVKPKTPMQKRLYECLKGILGHEDFGVTTELEEAGLTSISAIRLLVEITEQFHRPVAVGDLKDYGTIEKLEQYLQSAPQEEAGETRDYYPLTQTQLGIYIECKKNPAAVYYNLPCAFALQPDTDQGQLEDALQRVLHAHPSMRCAIRADQNGDVYMYPQGPADARIERVEGTEEQWQPYFAHFAKPFDFANGPLYRIAFYHTAQHLYLVIDFHHIISDGSSIAAFLQELDRTLRGQEPLGEVYTQYDLAVKEEKARAGEKYRQAKAYYDSLFGHVAAMPLPEPDVRALRAKKAADRGQEELPCGFYETACRSIEKGQVEAFCRRNKITENIFFLSVMGYVLGQYAHREDVVFTTVYNGRDDSRCMNTFGMLVKTIPIYADVRQEQEIGTYMGGLQKQWMESVRHGLYSFAEISRAYQVSPDIMFVYQGDAFSEFELGGQKTVLKEAVSDRAKAALSINVFVENGAYRFLFEYRKDCYSEAWIKRFYGIFGQAAKGFLSGAEQKALGELSILTEEERSRIAQFNDTAYPVPIMSVNRLFEAWAAKAPQRNAVIAGGKTLTYGQLNSLANRLAHGLLQKGVQPDSLVGCLLDRDQNVYITRQGILKAGAGFLPLVPAYPDERIDYCLRDAGCRFLITTGQIRAGRKELCQGKPYEVLTVEELLETPREENPGLSIPPEHLAYCLYTSGSTGKPKGVLVEHGNLCNFVHSNPKNIEITNYTAHGTVSLALAAITFDVSVMEEFIPLCNGMTICMANEEEIHNPLALARLILEHNVDIMKCTPSYMAQLVELPQMKRALQRIRAFDIGAEAFPGPLYDKMRSVNPQASIVNSYGPTECTVSCTTKQMEDSMDVTIGGPLANMKLYVTSPRGNILPVGISGELIICGAGVGRGYMNLPDKNKEAFFTFDGMKAYHSGDLVKWNDRGEIVFQGRLDNQVKLRGLRIELDEVEHAINSYPGIQASKAVVKNNGSEEFLAAYFTASSLVDTLELAAYVKTMLAHYMVPGAWMQLEEMPLTSHGKIDKSRLPELEYQAQEREYAAPANAREEEFCRLFAQILQLEPVGRTDNFFEAGGTSLSAAKIAVYCETNGYPIAYKDIFDHPTPAQLARLADGAKKDEKAAENITGFDYSSIQRVLAKNALADVKALGAQEKPPLGDILLTGATGFLGIHILYAFLRRATGKAYCLMRKGRHSTCEKRLKNLLMYYFDSTFDEAFGSRIVCVEGDITDRSLEHTLDGLAFQTVIHSAACVKHFVKDGLLEEINVQGSKNILDYCVKTGRQMVHISTTSVAGEGNAHTVDSSKRMRENELYFGQIIENDYIRTKFLAEREILSAAAGGAKVKIIRVGNLMSRKSDGEFQINFLTNGFMRTLKAYKKIGKFPMGQMHAPVEFSPIDSTAEAILTLAACKAPYTVFHAYNDHKVYMADVVYAMQAYGFPIEVVSDGAFDAALKSMEQDAANSETVLGLIAYASSDGIPRYEIAAENEFTVELLYRMQYKWPIIDDAYLKNVMKALDTLGFFD